MASALSVYPNSLAEFAPAGAKKVRSFSPATCAAEKILLGLQTCAPSASGGQRVRCSQAANPFVKKEYFLTVTGADAMRRPPFVRFRYISSTASMSGSAVRSPRRSPGCSGVRLWMGMSAQ